jgi:hypothetical protein
MRSVTECGQCGETREMAGRGLCFRCYRRWERGTEEGHATGIDRHNPGIRREQKRLIKAFADVMTGLADLGVARQHILEIRGILNPYLVTIQSFLAEEDAPSEREQDA